MKDPYSVILRRIITEKSGMLEGLQNRASNRSLAKCKTPKIVFEVALCANKGDIALAVEEIYREENVQVMNVNTLKVKGKAKRRGRGRLGATATYKKAIVTLREGDSIEKS